jgi:hypothetical protein
MAGAALMALTPEEIRAQVEVWLARDEANGEGRTITNPKVLAELARIIASSELK